MALQYRVIGPADRGLARAYARFVGGVFPGVDFDAWIDLGAWGDAYRAHVFLDGDEVVANVSVLSTELCVCGERVAGLEIGAVGVLPEHRGAGLLRQLWHRALPTEPAPATLAFLFANASVLDLYPRFGFRPIVEHAFGADHGVIPHGTRLSPLRFERRGDVDLLLDIAARTLPVTESFGALGYGPTVLFHALHDHRDHCFHVPGLDAIVVASEERQVLTIHDVLSARAFELKDLIPELAAAPIRRVELGFSPERWWPGARAHRANETGFLFVRGGPPLPTSPFRFPELART